MKNSQWGQIISAGAFLCIHSSEAFDFCVLQIPKKCQNLNFKANLQCLESPVITALIR